MDLNKILGDLRAEKERIDRAIAALGGSVARRGRKPGTVMKPKKKRRGGLTAAGRKRLSELMKKRWAERKRKGS